MLLQDLALQNFISLLCSETTLTWKRNEIAINCRNVAHDLTRKFPEHHVIIKDKQVEIYQVYYSFFSVFCDQKPGRPY